MATLFDTVNLGNKTLSNRIVLPPMTRCRTSQPGDVPNSLMAEYYTQRTTAGLIIAEACDITQDGKGYSFSPGIYTNEQIEGWKKVTSAVHSKDTPIFLQIWHTGRVSHPVFHNGNAPLAPSAIPFQGAIWHYDEAKQEGAMLPCVTPREATKQDIKNIVNDFKQAAINAIKAGFDGIEIHGANGYLVDQFMRDISNQRTDEYGGSIENKTRFVKEIITAIGEAIGFDRIGLRVAPFFKGQGMNSPDILDTIQEVIKFSDNKGIAYLHIAEADWDEAPVIPESFRQQARANFKHPIIVAGVYDKAKATQILAKGYADLIGFGRAYIANPDLPYRLENDIPLSQADDSTFFGGTAKGYTTYTTAS